MEDVLDVSHRPDDPKLPVLTMDELSNQPIAEVRRPLPAEPGQPKRLEEPPASTTNTRETARRIRSWSSSR
jgi:hypothetical protein